MHFAVAGLLADSPSKINAGNDVAKYIYNYSKLFFSIFFLYDINCPIISVVPNIRLDNNRGAILKNLVKRLSWESNGTALQV